MNFQISGLDERLFRHLVGQSPEVLATYGVERVTVDSHPGFPCRVSLTDVDVGETVLLMNFEHLPALSPYRSAHAIFVREGASRAIIQRMLSMKPVSFLHFHNAKRGCFIARVDSAYTSEN